MSKFDFLPVTEQQKKMDDPSIKSAIRLLKSKGITLKQIEDAFKYYDRLRGRVSTNESQINF